MEFLSLSDLQEEFNDLDHEALVNDFAVIAPYVLSIIPQVNYDQILDAIKKADFVKLVTAFHECDSEGITWFDHFNFYDIEEEVITQAMDDGLNIEKIFELINVYELLEDNNYQGCELDALAFISDEHFESYIRDMEVDAGNIADHLVKHVDWATFAQLAKLDYGAVEMDAPKTFGTQTFYYRK